MNKLFYRLFLSFLIVVHHFSLIIILVSVPLLFINEPIWISLPLTSWVIHLGCTRIDCPLTKLENYLRKELYLPQIKGFMSHYYKKPYQNFMWKIERNYFG